MSKTNYHLRLKGYVGGWDFRSSKVDETLAAMKGEHVDVLIDSTGGSLATGLSISAAFRDHGDVTVHFVGLNASAATIASLGAKRVTIDAGAMYLVHKCSMGFFKWDSMNADEFSRMIEECEKTKEDLDKLDLNCARMYARRCKRKTEDLLELMKRGGWLTPQEALAWGFVDEITELEEDAAAVLTESVASALAVAGLPLPDMPVAQQGWQQPISRLISAISSIFNRDSSTIINNAMNKTYTFICAALGLQAIALSDSKASLTDDQLSKIEDAMKAADDKARGLEAKVAELTSKLEAKDSDIADLQAKLDSKPAEDSKKVTETSRQAPAADEDDFVTVGASAKKLYDMLP